MQKHLACTLLLVAASAALAQISGTSDIDQRGSAGPVYGQNPQSSKMTPDGSKGKPNDVAAKRDAKATGAAEGSSGASGTAAGTSAAGNGRADRAGRDRQRERNTRDDDRTRAGASEK